MIKMNRNKEYRLKRKAQKKDYIIQDKNLIIKTLYCRNETKRNKIEQLEQKNEQLQNNWNELKEWAEERIKNANEYLNDPDKNWDEDANGYVLARKFQSEETLKKMQELEQGKDE